MPVPGQSRGRACQSCQSIKIKCELGATGGPPPCERCTRLSKTCILAPPKRQKDRVAELEARVEALTKLLGAQGLSESAETSNLPTLSMGSDEHLDHQATVSLQKKRKLEALDFQTGSQMVQDVPVRKSLDDDASQLDRILSIDLQQRVLDEYIASYQSVLPVVPLQKGTKADVLRKTMPHTLHAIVYIASCGILSWDLQDQINVALVEDLTKKTLAQCKLSLDLLQALQLACLWYRSPRNSTQIPLFQLVNIASDMVVDLGYGGVQNPPSLSIAGMAEGLQGGIVACRTWLVSFIIAETTAVLRRRPNPQKWTSHHEECLSFLETSEQYPNGEHLPQLAQHTRATHLLGSISDEMDLSTSLISPVVGTATCQQTMCDLQDRITAWRLQVPMDLWSATLSFDGFYMELILYEPVLHTPTNKETFAAPFLIERLSLTDVPIPSLSQHHIQAVHALKAACHNLLDSAASFTDTELISLPTMIYAPRMAHAAVTLLRLHIAVTAEGNTYGQALDEKDLQIRKYLDKGLEMMTRARKIDSESVTVRILVYMEELKKWMRRYESSRTRPEENYDECVDHVLGESNAAASTSLKTERTVHPWSPGPAYGSDMSFAAFDGLEPATDDFDLFNLFTDNDWNPADFGA